MHRRIIYKRDERNYRLLIGSNQPNRKVTVMDFAIIENPDKIELSNPFRLAQRKVDWEHGKLIGTYETEEEAYDQMEYFLEMSFIYADTEERKTNENIKT